MGVSGSQDREAGTAQRVDPARREGAQAVNEDPQVHDFEGDNGDALTEEEFKAIRGLQLLAYRWPRSLMLISTEGRLVVVHASDPRWSEPSGADRAKAVLADFPEIPSDGGDR
jgi:hypothetical protein